MSSESTKPVAAPPPSPVSVRKQLRYGAGPVEVPAPGEAPLLLDLYRPKNAARPRPAVIFIHGGGFRSGSREDPEAVRTSRALARSGIVTASIDYRVQFQRPVPSKRFAPLVPRVVPPPSVPPSADFSRAAVTTVEDTLTAIRYLRGHARRLGIDPGRIGLVGGSAGAITADHIAYVLDDYGIEPPKISFVGSLWGAILIQSRDGGNAASQLEEGEAPLFAAHGDRDPSIPVEMSDDLVARARAQHVPSEYVRISGGGHDPPTFFTGGVSGKETGLQRLVAFAVAQLRP